MNQPLRLKRKVHEGLGAPSIVRVGPTPLRLLVNRGAFPRLSGKSDRLQRSSHFFPGA